MVQRGPVGNANFVGDALAALGIGVWSWRDSPARVHCCPMAARLFGVPTAVAWEGLPFEHFATRVHPEDRARFIEMVGQAQRIGGPFVAEYRTLDEAGETHSVLDRGEFELGPDGFVIAARGLIFDLTDRPRGSEIVSSVSGAPDFADLPPLHQAVEHGLALHRLLGAISEGNRHIAETLLRTVLEMLGREVAASLRQSGGRPEKGGIH